MSTKYLKFENNDNSQVSIDKCEILVYYNNLGKEYISLKYKFGNNPYNELIVPDLVPTGAGSATFRNISIPFPSNYKPLSVLIWGKDYSGSTGCSDTNSFRISSSITYSNKFSFSTTNDSLYLSFPVDIKKFSELGVTSFNRGSCPNTTSLVGKIVILYDNSGGDILKTYKVLEGKKYDSESDIKKEIEYYSSSRYIGIL